MGSAPAGEPATVGSALACSVAATAVALLPGTAVSASGGTPVVPAPGFTVGRSASVVCLQAVSHSRQNSQKRGRMTLDMGEIMVRVLHSISDS